MLSFEGQNTRALKRFVCKLLRFPLRRRFCQQNWYYLAQLYTSSISTYFYNHASRSQKGKISRWSEQADLASQCFECSPPANEKPRDKMRIHLNCNTTYGCAKFVPHREFLSPIRFSTLRLLRRRKQTWNFLAFSSGHEEELKLSLSTTKANYSNGNHRIKNSSLARLFRSTKIAPQFTLHVTKLFSIFPFLNLNSEKQFFPFFVKIHLPWYLKSKIGSWGEGKTGVPGEKPLGAETRTNKLNPLMIPDPGIKTGTHWWTVGACCVLGRDT